LAEMQECGAVDTPGRASYFRSDADADQACAGNDRSAKRARRLVWEQIEALDMWGCLHRRLHGGSRGGRAA
jgi:hypothetical protein